jgi:DNA-binding MarR family transcriptional regulator
MASRQVTRLYDRALAPLGITTNAYSILARLDREGSQPLGALAARLAMDRTTLSREVTPLCDAGLVDIVSGELDRRQRMLSLTPAGARLVKKARPLHAAAQAELTNTFGLERATELLDELRALVGADA